MEMEDIINLEIIEHDDKENIHDNGLSFPELTRLHNFIQDLDDELECEAADIDMFKTVSQDLNEYDDANVELYHDFQEANDYIQEATMQFTNLPVTPINELYRGFTPHQTPYFINRPRSNLDIFLLALADAGYTNIDPGNVQQEAPTGYTTLANEFFGSALDNGELSPVVNPNLSEPNSTVSSQNRKSIPFGIENMSAESLRRNWDLDDDEEDGSSGGGISPKSPANATDIKSANNNNSSMQFPELLLCSPSPASPNSKKYNTKSASSLLSATTDPRLHGDFNVWSGGPMLSADSIHHQYLGLHATALTHHISEGKLLPCADLAERIAVATSSVSKQMSGLRNFYDGPYELQDIALSPVSAQNRNPASPTPASSSSNMSTTSIYAHQQQNVRSISSGTSLNVSRRLSQHQGQLPFFYNRHVMECVLRPDRELKHIVLSLCGFFFDRQYTCQQLQANHLVIFPVASTSSSTAKSLNNLDNTDDIETPSLDWDLLDIQVCLSRDLKQRILLVQFLHKIPLSLVEGVGFGTLGLSSSNNNQSNNNANTSSGGSIHTGPTILTAGILPDTLPLRACPATRKLAMQIKKMLISEQLTLSALYSVPIPEVCALPKGLDTHFLALLHSLTREQLWVRLRDEFRTMDGYVQQLEDHTNQFVKLLEPIYKAYGMSTQSMIYKASSQLTSQSSHSQSRSRQAPFSLASAINQHHSIVHKNASTKPSKDDITATTALFDASTNMRSSAAILTAVVAEDKLMAVRTPFPTSDTPASSIHSTPLRGVVEDHELEHTAVGSGLNEDSSKNEVIITPAIEVNTLLTPQRKQRASYAIVTNFHDEHTTAEPLASVSSTTPPPSALKSPSGRKTPNRSVTIRLDTNTFHDAHTNSHSANNIGRDADALPSNHFSTPERYNPNQQEHSQQAEGQEAQLPETPLSALTTNTTPGETPKTPDTLMSINLNSTQDSSVTMSSNSTTGKTFSMFSTPKDLKVRSQQALFTGPVSPGTARVIMQTDMSPASVKTRLQEQYAQNSKVDGMVFCLIMRDKIYQELQHSCDQEYAEKMCNRHNLSLLAVQDLTAHKKALLMAIVCHPTIHKSTLMKTFYSTFEGVSVTRWCLPHTIVGIATILPTSKTTTTVSNASSNTVNNKRQDSASNSTASNGTTQVKSFFTSFFNNNSSSTTNNHTNNSSNNTATMDTANTTTNPLVISSAFPIQDEVVLYYFTMLTHGGQQGTVYLTARYVCIVSSLMGFMNTKKEIFMLADLTEYVVTTSGESMLSNNNNENGGNHNNNSSSNAANMAAGLFGGIKLLKLVWQDGQREILFRPLLVDASRVHMVFTEILAHFKSNPSTITSTP